MDYGHTVNPGNILQDNPADNLNMDNWGNVSENVPTSTESTEGRAEVFDTQNTALGQAALRNPAESNMNNAQSEVSPLGQITPTDPYYTPEPSRPATFNRDNIRTSGDSLEKSSIAEVDHVLDELSQTGNLSNFYNEIRDMTEANLDNSYNRKLGA